MSPWLGLAARLGLVLLLVGSPSMAAIIPSDSLLISGVSDGADGGGDDGSRVAEVPIVTPNTPMFHARPVMAPAQFRLPDSQMPPESSRRPGSSRSPPPQR
jgi:hypothetical protein